MAAKKQKAPEAPAKEQKPAPAKQKGREATKNGKGGGGRSH
mgnify:FL=1